MSDSENISFEDDDIGNMDMDFDDLSMDAEDQPDTRDPVTKLKSNFYSGVITKVTDTNYLEGEIKQAMPSGYNAAYDETKKQYNQLDKAGRDLINPIRKELPQFKRNLNRLSPMVKRIVGDRYGNKFDEITKVKETSQEVDPDQAEMQSGLSNIFGVWRESQLSDREQDLSDKFMTAKTDEDRFKAKYETLTKISNYMSRQVSFNDGVLIKVHEKSLELDFKKYHLLRNLLRVTAEGNNTSIGELKAITKNTGLPDIIKRQNSENFKQLFLDEWQGRTTANIVDFGKDYFSQMATNIGKKAQETGNAIAEGMGTLGDVASSFADMDEMQRDMGGPQKSGKDMVLDQVGKAGGGIVGTKVVGFFADMLSKRMKDDPTAQSTNSWLSYLMSNKEQITKDYIDEKAGGEDGLVGKFFQFLQGVSPTIASDRESLTNTLAAKATQEAQWDRISRETVIKIIPGWLSKIHQVLNSIASGDRNVEAETFDIYSETFVKQSQSLKNIEDRLVSESSISEVRDNVDSVIDALFKSNEELRETLTTGQLDILENAIIRSANNDVGTDLKAFGKTSTYESLKDTSEEDAKVLAEALGKVLGTDRGKFTRDDFTTRGGQADKNLNVIKQFKKLKVSNPETQKMFNLLNATGGTSKLEQLGYGKRDENGVLNLDFDNLYNRKLGKFTGNIPASVSNSDLDVGSLNPTDRLDPTVDLARDNIERQMSVVSIESEQYSKLEEQLNNLNRVSNRIADFNEGRTSNKVELEQISIDAIREAIDTIYQAQRTPSRNSTIDPDNTDEGVVSKLTETNLTLSDVRGVLLNMFASQQANHDEMMGRNSFGSTLKDLGVGISNFIKAPFKLVTTTFTKSKEFAKKHFNKVKNFGKNLIGAPVNFVKGVFGEVSAQVFSPPDIYVIGQKDAAILGKELKKGIFFNIDENGKIESSPIKEIEDIKGKVINKEANVVAITLEEFKLGLETRVPTKAKRVGGALAKLAMLPIKAVARTYKFGTSVFTRVTNKLKDIRAKAIEKAKAFTVYDVTGKLLVSREDIESGTLYIMRDGKRITVTKVSDMTDTVYSYVTGEPVISADQLKEGLRDKFGKLIKLDTSKFVSKIVKGGKLIGKLLASPFKLMGKGTKALLKIFEGKLVSSLLVNVPDNVIFKANVVNLFADTINSNGKGTPKRPTSKRPTTGLSREEKLSALKSKLSDKATKLKDEVTDAKSKFMTGKGKELKEDAISKSKTFKDNITAKAKEAKGSIIKKKDEVRKSKYMDGLLAKVDKLVSSSKDVKGQAKDIASGVAAGLAAQQAKDKALNAWGNIRKKSPRGDGDGDGLRDGGWKEQLRDKAKSVKNKLIPKKKEDKPSEGSGGNIVKALMMLVSPIISMLGSLTGLPVISTLTKIGSALGVGTLIKGTLGGAKNLVTKGVTKVASSSVMKAAAGYGAKKLAGSAVVGGLAAGGAVVGGVALAPIIGIGLAIWTAYEIGSSLWGYFDRRSDIKKIEYLRMLSYGYYVGNDGAYEDRKVTLRYFEAEMLDRMEKNDSGVVTIEGSIDELWEDYCGEFGSSYGDASARTQWTGWFEHRFKPIFFKWITVVGTLNKSVSRHPRISKTYSLDTLDDKLKAEQYPNFVKAVLTFDEVDYDPLDLSDSAYTSVGIQAKRSQIQAYVDKTILKDVNGVVIDEETDIKTPDQIKNKPKIPDSVKDVSVKTLTNKSKLTSNSGSVTKLSMGGGPQMITVKPFDPRHSIILDTLNGDDVTKSKLVPLVDKALVGILVGRNDLVSMLRKEFEKLVPLEDSGKSGSQVNDWITQVLIPLVRQLSEMIGTTDGYFNEIDPTDLKGIKDTIRMYGISSAGNGLILANGVVKSPILRRSRISTRNQRKLDTSRFVDASNITKVNVLQDVSEVPESTGIKENIDKGLSEGNSRKPISTRAASQLAKARERANKMRRAAGSPEIDYSAITSKSTRNKGGVNDLDSKVTIQPISLQNSNTEGSKPAPHKLTDTVEGKISGYNDLIHQASIITGIDEHLIRSIIRQTSAGDPKAKSNDGSIGLIPLSVEVAKLVGVNNRSDPKQSIMGGAEYIKRQLKRFDGVPELALASFSVGSSNVEKAISKAGTSDPETVLNTLSEVTGKHSKETQDYVVKITNDYRKRTGASNSVSSRRDVGVSAATKLHSSTPATATIKPRVPTKTTTEGAPSTTGSSGTPNEIVKVTNRTSDSVEKVIGLQEENTLRTRAVSEQQVTQIGLYNDHMLAVNTDQLLELRVLNQRMSDLATKLTPPSEQMDTHANKQNEDKLYKEAAKSMVTQNRFKRRTVEGKPPISLDRKIM